MQICGLPHSRCTVNPYLWEEKKKEKEKKKERKKGREERRERKRGRKKHIKMSKLRFISISTFVIIDDRLSL